MIEGALYVFGLKLVAMEVVFPVLVNELGGSPLPCYSVILVRVPGA